MDDAADPLFSDPRLAALYDLAEAGRDDLDAYLALVDEAGARRVLDVGCGTGTLACALAARGIEVVAVDPATASLDVARAKPSGERVRWIHGDATTLPALAVDLAVMTANVAQVFRTDEAWLATLRGIRAALVPGGRLAFEIRDVRAHAWTEWDRAHTERDLRTPDGGSVRTWCELTAVELPLVSFRWSFDLGGAAPVVSDSTLRFRSRDEIAGSLREAGYDLDEVRDAPDRPGRELVFLATRT